MSFVYNPMIVIQRAWWWRRWWGSEYYVYLTYAAEVERHNVIYAEQAICSGRHCQDVAEVLVYAEQLKNRINGDVAMAYPDGWRESRRELEAELKWLQREHVRVCSSESKLRELLYAEGWGDTSIDKALEREE